MRGVHGKHRKVNVAHTLCVSYFTIEIVREGYVMVFYGWVVKVHVVEECAKGGRIGVYLPVTEGRAEVRVSKCLDEEEHHMNNAVELGAVVRVVVV